MTFTRWKWLHRLVYAGGILAVLHIWSVGSHVAGVFVQATALLALIILAGLETFRVVTLFAKKQPDFQRKDYFATAFLGLWAVWCALILVMPAIVQNYHDSHHESTFRRGHQ